MASIVYAETGGDNYALNPHSTSGFLVATEGSATVGKFYRDEVSARRAAEELLHHGRPVLIIPATRMSSPAIEKGHG